MPLPPPAAAAESLFGTLLSLGKINVLAHMQTGNFVVDTLLSTLVFAVINWVVQHWHDWWEQVKAWWTRDNTVKSRIYLDGKRYDTTYMYSADVSSTFHFTNRFRAVLFHVQQQIQHNRTVRVFLEFGVETKALDSTRQLPEVFMIFQRSPVQLTPEIFARFHWNSKLGSENDDGGSGNQGGNQGGNQKKQDMACSGVEPKVQQYRIEVYSHTLDLHEVVAYVDKLTDDYVQSVRLGRKNDKHIYSLEHAEINRKEGQSEFCRWSEVAFKSTRTFDNLFFDGKEQVLQKIDFFLQHKDWYFAKGIPYTLGIGLHGPPGTGKTSFIKALANYTARSLVVISLKLVKTRRQLESVFFQNSYRSNCPLEWDQKIVVFEDLDCLGDVVLDRAIKEQERKENAKLAHALHATPYSASCSNSSSSSSSSNLVTEEAMLDRIMELNIRMSSDMEKDRPSYMTKKAIEDDGGPLTLDDLLNLWDGIKECPGRIMVVTSNFYHRLDRALVRPGRIDITHELTFASRQVVGQIFQHLYGVPMDPATLAEVPDNRWTPAELMNAYFAHRDPTDFVKIFASCNNQDR